MIECTFAVSAMSAPSGNGGLKHAGRQVHCGGAWVLEQKKNKSVNWCSCSTRPTAVGVVLMILVQQRAWGKASDGWRLQDLPKWT